MGAGEGDRGDAGGVPVSRLRLAITWTLAVVILLAAITVGIGCRSDKPKLIVKSARPASRFFEGFAYAGELLASKPNNAHVSSLSPFRLLPQSLPPRFLPGHEYAFHHPLPVDDMALAQKVLAPRLPAEGYALTETVNGIFFRGYWEIDCAWGGYMLWAIQFKRDKCIGVIGHDLDDALRRNPWPVIKKTWEPADYVLTVEGSCDL
jgi:hypothetical protein